MCLEMVFKRIKLKFSLFVWCATCVCLIVICVIKTGFSDLYIICSCDKEQANELLPHIEWQMRNFAPQHSKSLKV